MWHSSLTETLADRRQALQTFFSWGAVAAGAGLGLAACDRGAPPAASSSGAEDSYNKQSSKIDFSNPAESLKAFIKLTGDLDPGAETVGWFGGDIFAVLGPDKALQKILSVEGFGVLRVSPQTGDKYRLFNRELAYYKDPKTGEFLDVWTNPFTGEEVEVKPIHNKVVNAEVAPVMKMDFDGTMIELPFSPPWNFFGDKAFSLFEVHTAFPNPLTPAAWPRESAGPVTRISEMFQRFTSLSQLEDNGRSFADYSGSWTRIGPWMPWMLQGQVPGHLFFRTSMDRTGTADRLPAALRSRAEKLHPEYFKAPGDETWGGPNDSSFSVYMAENEPKA
ncbi:MAG: DUF1838 domain-containing protein [Chromatiales bacterium]|nr:MAG: DUF1838 domain-containing protein [Chromatiales bacterium]